jgi:hypothetical protein
MITHECECGNTAAFMVQAYPNRRRASCGQCLGDAVARELIEQPRDPLTRTVRHVMVYLVEQED